mgnify:CR=1 FL=1
MLKIVGFGSGSKVNMTLEAVRAIQDSDLCGIIKTVFSG